MKRSCAESVRNCELLIVLRARRLDYRVINNDYAIIDENIEFCALFDCICSTNKDKMHLNIFFLYKPATLD